MARSHIRRCVTNQKNSPSGGQTVKADGFTKVFSRASSRSYTDYPRSTPPYAKVIQFFSARERKMLRGPPHSASPPLHARWAQKVATLLHTDTARRERS